MGIVAWWKQKGMYPRNIIIAMQALIFKWAKQPACAINHLWWQCGSSKWMMGTQLARHEYTWSQLFWVYSGGGSKSQYWWVGEGSAAGMCKWRGFLRSNLVCCSMKNTTRRSRHLEIPGRPSKNGVESTVGSSFITVTGYPLVLWLHDVHMHSVPCTPSTRYLVHGCTARGRALYP